MKALWSCCFACARALESELLLWGAQHIGRGTPKAMLGAQAFPSMYLFSWLIVALDSLSSSSFCRRSGWPWSLILMEACSCCPEALRGFCLCVSCSVVYVKCVTDLSASLEAVITSQLTLRGVNNIAESCRNWMSEQEISVSFQFSPGWRSRCVGTVLLPFLLFSAKQRSSAVGMNSLVPSSPEHVDNTRMMKYSIQSPSSIDGIIQYCHQ